MGRENQTKINRYIARRVLIVAFCMFIAISVLMVMLKVYNPNQNAIGALCSVCMDIICIVILFILIGSFAFDRYVANRTTRLFWGLLVATIWATFLDFLNWAFDGSLKFGHLTFWFTAGSLCMGAVLACLFSMYLYCYMEETHNFGKMKLSARVCAILNVISFVLTFVLAMSGTAFQFVDGHYEVGALYDVVAVIPILTVLYLTGFLICHIKEIGFHDVFAAAGYIFFMVAGALIETQYSIGTTYVAVSIADFFIFVMLQNEIIAREKQNVQKWMQKSNTDELTGCYNRYAYENEVNRLDGSMVDDDFVYVSIDVNSLKIVNDSLGHSAGDELLIGAAKCLEKSLGAYGNLYRIGGDEFIALIYVSVEQLEEIKKNVNRTVEQWKGKLVDSLSVSCGYVAKRESIQMSVRQMAILADKRMYEDKEEYYKNTGIERRNRHRH